MDVTSGGRRARGERGNRAAGARAPASDPAHTRTTSYETHTHTYLTPPCPLLRKFRFSTELIILAMNENNREKNWAKLLTRVDHVPSTTESLPSMTIAKKNTRRRDLPIEKWQRKSYVKQFVWSIQDTKKNNILKLVFKSLTLSKLQSNPQSSGQ